MRIATLAAAVGLGCSLGLAAAPSLAADPSPPAAGAASPSAALLEPEAKAALDRMSAYLGTLTSFEVTTQSSLDLVTNDDERLQLDGSAKYQVKRPNGFVIEVSTDAGSRQFIYDGKQFTVYSPKLGYYASAPAPATIRETLDAIDRKFGISLPLEDLFRWNDPTNPNPPKITSGFKVGPATIDGAAADQYAFRGEDVDWQIWIQQGDKPLPLKVVIIDRSDPARPAYEAKLSWNLTPTFAADTFTFKPDKDAKQIRIASASLQ